MRTSRRALGLPCVSLGVLATMSVSVCLATSCATPTAADLMRHLAAVTVACLDEETLVSCEEACNARVPEACLRLGDLWEAEDATTGEQRHVVAWEWACQLGASQGCVKVAQVLEQTEDTDPSQVGLHLEVACTHGDVEGCLALARWLASAAEGWADPERSEAIYDALCDRGVSEACEVLMEDAEPEPSPDSPDSEGEASNP